VTYALIVLVALIFVAGNLFALALCRAAAAGDRMIAERGTSANRYDVVESSRSTLGRTA